MQIYRGFLPAHRVDTDFLMRRSVARVFALAWKRDVKSELVLVVYRVVAPRECTADR
jgi:hypothetical protein